MFLSLCFVAYVNESFAFHSVHTFLWRIIKDPIRNNSNFLELHLLPHCAIYVCQRYSDPRNINPHFFPLPSAEPLILIASDGSICLLLQITHSLRISFILISSPLRIVFQQVDRALFIHFLSRYLTRILIVVTDDRFWQCTKNKRTLEEKETSGL